jgi:glutamate racemase
MDQRPIGIFDSGIGGLTVASAIRQHLPNESLLYFGDTAHLPYGDKSPELIRHYASHITHFLLKHNCKAIVIACNTASAHGFQTVSDVCGPQMPVLNVIDPVAEAIASAPQLIGKRVGVIATKGTVQSRVYPRRIRRLTQEVKVVSLATPLLAPMIEEGFFSNSISRTVIHSYLSKPALKGIHALILGCTHYPLIKHEVAEYYKNAIDLFDANALVAQKLGEILNSRGLTAGWETPELHFMVSDKTAAFEKSTRIFFGERIQLEEVDIWEHIKKAE